MVSTEYAFQLLDQEAFQGEGPFFTFFRRDESAGDNPVFVRNPPEGLLWSTESEFGSASTHKRKGGNPKPPTPAFINTLSALMDDPKVRAVVSTEEVDPDLATSTHIDEETYRQLPLHEHYFLKLIVEMVERKYPFPPELTDYLLGL